MRVEKSPILVFGATGQQGGSVATALLKAGWQVRAMVRDPGSRKAEALRNVGVELVQGDFDDLEAMRAAMVRAYGVFSVQPSSPGGVVSDDDEVRYGTTIADLAVEAGVKHLVYTSGSAAGGEPTGVAHYDTKTQIEQHIRTLPMTFTIVRPATFMELLLMPGFGLDQGRYTFFMHPDKPIQVLAVEDIGRIVAAAFDDPARFGGEAFEIASDAIMGRDLEELFSQMAGRPIRYARFPDDVLAANPFLQKLAALVDDGRLAGNADLDALRQVNPELWSFKAWLQGPGRQIFEQALRASDNWEFNRPGAA
ncbi:NmrA/HSCARG family protein [Rhizobium sp. SIMBA_035]